MRHNALRINIACLVLALILPAVSAVSHGDKGRAEDKQRSAHMRAMYALKEQIPEEYRIMERTPLMPTEQSLAQGKEAFKHHCVLCHGNSGRGDGPAAKELPTPPADFLDLQHSAIYGPGEKFWIIGNGSGDTGMPAFPHLDVRTRWNLVNYIYILQELKTAPGEGHHHH